MEYVLPDLNTLRCRNLQIFFSVSDIFVHASGIYFIFTCACLSLLDLCVFTPAILNNFRSFSCPFYFGLCFIKLSFSMLGSIPNLFSLRTSENKNLGF